ncbi:adenylylsulfate kinase [Caballeronia mineralivorans PML1(12)]|uniref:Adenylyl-sulfate kinase n=1 Tax=Caballeronia mineralivorans PML1(12) TaxID=908627 RepID=A0A0J1D525_9BURK|nr:adenylylsulfate kinase [Caballeronia mineralivorans PML1(12)]
MAAATHETDGRVLWLTGLSGAGKSTLAYGLKHHLDSQGIQSVVLDGDALRTGLNVDLGFSVEDRAENVRRVTEVARLFQQAGFIVITALISPLHAQREAARRTIGDGFFEIYVDARLAVCEARDPKGLYARARRGEIQEFTGLSSPYEKPIAADLVIDTERLTLQQSIGILHCFALSASRSSTA